MTIPSLGPSLKRLSELDGLRGVLALYVCVYHLTNSFPLLQAAIAEHAYLLRNGWFAVDVFFVLSGFVMTYVYDATFSAGVSFKKYREFFLARVARLYPVHLVTGILLFVAVLPFVITKDSFLSPNGRYSWGSWLASLFMLHGPWVDHRTWNYPSWSVSAEWHAYMLFPLMVPFIRRKGIAIVVAGLGVLVPLIVYAANLANEQFPTNGPIVLLRVLPLFAAGVALYRLRDFAILSRTPVALAVTVGIAGCLYRQESAPYAVLLIPVLVGATLNNHLLGAFFRRKAMVSLGDISYSLYMVHAPIQIIVVDRLASRIQMDLFSSMIMLVCGVVVSLIAGSLLHRAIERPGREWVRKHFVSLQQLSGRSRLNHLKK